MKTYLVGGAVRDQLLGIDVHERDWVVVGATAEEMLDKDYRQVGRDFPVFLHPTSKEEYALARTERKQGHGHQGFAVHADPAVSLEQDLLRRDLTINAIAQQDNGRLIDPCNGLADISSRTLRHISDAFAEDPLRVLRVARFAAKLQHLGFTVAPETLQLMTTMSRSGELQHLSAERIWVEVQKGLGETSPQAFIQTLYQCEAMASLLPELNQRFHEHDNMLDVASNIGARTLAALAYAAKKNYCAQTRWAITLHSVDSSSRPKNLIAKVISDKHKTEDIITTICLRLKTPNDYQQLARLTAYYIDFAIQAVKSKPDVIISLLDICDAWRKPERFEQFLQACESLVSTNTEQAHSNLASIAFLRTAYTVCRHIDASEFIKRGITGEAVGESIRNARKVEIATLKKQF